MKAWIWLKIGVASRSCSRHSTFPYPKFGVATRADEAIKIANEVGYPVLVRPSYVLGGQGMEIVINDEDLERAVIKLLGDLPGNRVLIDHFLDRAEETESDSICDGDESHIIGSHGAY